MGVNLLPMPVATREDHVYFYRRRDAYLDFDRRTCPRMAVTRWWLQLVALLNLAIGGLNAECTLDYRLLKHLGDHGIQILARSPPQREQPSTRHGSA